MEVLFSFPSDPNPSPPNASPGAMLPEEANGLQGVTRCNQVCFSPLSRGAMEGSGADPRLPGPPGGGRGDDTVQAQVDDELSVVIGNRIERSHPKPVAAYYPVPERKLHGLN
jgi:hypothetical protein